MATPPNTGAQALTSGVANAAANLGPVALQLASGAGLLRTATDTLKGATLDKLLGPTAILAGGLFGIVRTMKAIVDQTGILERGLKNIANIQQIQGKFETLLKSAEKATQRIKELHQFTANSTFDFSDVAEANRILEALTKGALSSAKGMQLVGDVAASTGQSMTDVAERVGKLYAALRSGRSLDKLMFQMQATGAVTDDLAAQLEGLEQAGASFADKWSAVTTALSVSEGGMKNEMASLNGLKQQLKNAGETMETAFGQPFLDAQTKSIQNTVEATKNLTPLVAQIARDIQPLIGIKSNLANVITDATFATKGFASALNVAWQVGKSLFVGVGATAAVSMGASLASAGQRGLALGRSIKAGRASLAAASAGTPGAHVALQEGATAALQAGNLVSAAGLGAQALWARASTTAMTAHTVALGIAKAKTGEFSLSTYAAAMASQTLRGALGLLWTGVTKVAGGVASFVMANPLILAATAAATAGVAITNVARAIAKTNEEYIDLVQNVAAATREIDKQVKAVANLDQYRQAKADVETGQGKLVEQINQMGERPKERYETTMGADYRTRTRLANGVEIASYDERRKVLTEGMAKLQMSRNALDAKLPNVGLSRDERARVADDVSKRAQLADAIRQTESDRGGDAYKLQLLREQRAQLARDIEVGSRNDAGRRSPDRAEFANNPTELMQLSREIARKEKANEKVQDYEYAQQADLNRLADSHVDNRIKAEGLDSTIRTLNESLRIKKVELDYDSEIAAVRAMGGRTATMEAAKELAVMKEQLRIAVEKGAASADEADRIRANIADYKSKQAEARASFALERAGNNAQINRNPRAARALQDNADLAELRSRYLAAGLSEKRADADWRAGLMAQAAQAAPRIVADSLQSVGGGGGSSVGNPMLAAQQRRVEQGATANAYLRIIAEAAKNSGGEKLAP